MYEDFGFYQTSEEFLEDGIPHVQMQLDLTNIKPRFRSKRLQRNFGFVFDYIDTSALTGQAYLPAMISEATADYYHSRRTPAVSREIIRASRV